MSLAQHNLLYQHLDMETTKVVKRADALAATHYVISRNPKKYIEFREAILLHLLDGRSEDSIDFSTV